MDTLFSRPLLVNPCLNAEAIAEYEALADAALARLMEGNARFLRGEPRNAHTPREVLAGLARADDEATRETLDLDLARPHGDAATTASSRRTIPAAQACGPNTLRAGRIGTMFGPWPRSWRRS